MKHGSGKNSRGVTQFQGEVIHKLLLLGVDTKIDNIESKPFLNTLIYL
ncbi:MAG: hypothetical protein QM520_03230 [Gammaproteobacteria bacterium]|nr:hypothetical protein [Gammaproteobacteria bacterium]